jgi:hypothetical protein
LVLGIGSSGIFARVQRDPGTLDHRGGGFTKPDILVP